VVTLSAVTDRINGAVVGALVGVLLVGACGGGEDREPEKSGTSTSLPRSEPVSILTSLAIAATEGSEPIATGKVLEGSTLGGSPLCVGGTIRDSHANSDPAVEPYGLIARTITCPHGTLKIGVTPETGQSQTQTGSWTLVSGTGAFDGLSGSGKMEVTYDPDHNALARETLTGTVTAES
jgi:hypothetical protein